MCGCYPTAVMNPVANPFEFNFGAPLRIQGGNARFHRESAGHDQWNLDDGGDPVLGPERRSFATISFPRAFAMAPNVTVSLSGLDSSNGAITRIYLEVVEAHPDRFVVAMSTWHDSVVFGVWVSWLAVGY